MWLGIDFGTTNTVAAALGHDGRPAVLPLDAAAPEAGVLRTLLYVERDGVIHVGEDAVRTYRAQNVGRAPRFVKLWVGVIGVFIGEFVAKGYEIKGHDEYVDVYADVDADAPGRLLHSLKGPLATDYAGTKLFGRNYTLEELIAEFLARVRERAESLTGRQAREAVFGRPVNFAGASTEADNARAQSRLQQAAELAGFREVRFEMEPIAAGLAFGAQQTMREGDHAMVFDFGGGTLDIAVLRAGASGRQEVLATGGVGIAGDRFDQDIFRHAMLPWFGRDVRWGPQRLNMPAHLLDALGDWQDVSALTNDTTLRFLRAAQADCTDPIRLLALEDFIFKGHAFDVYDRVEQCKVALSSERFGVVSYDAEAISIWQPVTRPQFESYIAAECREIRRVVEETLARCAVPAARIDHVIRTGGSSAIPYFVTMLADMFGREKVAEADRFTSVAAGLAVRAGQIER